MLANFTEETCTGTGNTLALTGATTNRIPFGSANGGKFNNGDTVAYVVEDSGGTIKVAGIGTYVSATDDITRNDTWNWNGTVIDDNPATNITLSGGTHTIRCSLVTNTIRPPIARPTGNVVICGEGDTRTTFIGFTADIFYAAAFELKGTITITKLNMAVDALIAASSARLGLYTVGIDGKPNKLIVESGIIDTSTTGSKQATVAAVTLPPGIYYAAMVGNAAIDIGAINIAGQSGNILGGLTDNPRTYNLMSGAFTFGALPATAPAVTFNTLNATPLIWIAE